MQIRENNSIAIIGFHDGSAGQITEWFERTTGYLIKCFVIETEIFAELNIMEENRNRVCKTTDFPQDGKFKGRPIIYSSDWVPKLLNMGIYKVLCLDPDNKRRQEQINLVRNSELKLVSAIHPTATILDKARLSDGVWINAGSIIGYKAEIEAGVIINTGVHIDHHNVLHECCQVDPGVVTAGNVVLGLGSHIHTGAVIINKVRIGEGAIVGAGAVVLKDLPSHCTAVGVPAKIIKLNKL
jgi:sugar O-acyltransferase (sialic acid O-acetyltransferase NeuD family)